MKTVSTAITIKKSDRILIIGGTGFLGQHLINRCLEDTFNITCINLSGRLFKGKYLNNLEFIQADITRQSQLHYALRGKSFDYVFNLGGYIDHTPFFNGGRKIIETHFVSLMNLLDCLDRERLKAFVQVGSSDEYGNSPAPQKETMREMPISPYSLAKTASSHFIQMLHRTEGFPGVVLRFFLVYGTGQDKSRFLPQIINAFLKDETIETTKGEQLRDFCYVKDVVEGMINAALTPEAHGHIINIASGVPISIYNMIEKVYVMVGKGKPIFGIRPYRKGENMELYADINLAKSILNWKPQTSLEDGIKKTIEYYRRSMIGGKQ